MRKSFEFISDPGHGWLKVDLQTLAELGMKLSDFSGYSYLFYNRRKGAMSPFILLEEDCDAELFARTYRAKTGREITTRHRYTNQFAGRFNRAYFSNGKTYHKYIAANETEREALA